MKGNEKLITVFNLLLANELTAIKQYLVYSEMCANWGYGKLHLEIRKQAMAEMSHAEWLIERIIFLDGAPILPDINPLKIGKTVLEMINNDNVVESHTVRAYNAAIKLGREVNDQGSVDLLSKILKMEEEHVDWAEIQHAQIEQMGIENYLANQTESTVY
jgi:bacterioferritin